MGAAKTFIRPRSHGGVVRSLAIFQPNFFVVKILHPNLLSDCDSETYYLKSYARKLMKRFKTQSCCLF